MRITFLGATHEVTGSCTYLECAGKRILVDCGMEQGVNVYENEQLPVGENQIDFILLTHAHIDHSGLIPLATKNGFSGTIFATEATCELCDIMLRDSAHIQEFEAEWRNRKGKRQGKETFIPLYDTKDAMAALALFTPVAYAKKLKIADGIEIRFVDVGHLLGSASIEIWVTENENTTKLVFSGDIGNINQPLLKDPSYITNADYVIMESTYGDRSHGEKPDYVAELSQIMQTTFDRGGNVVIPSFAVGRTQELLYFIRKIKADNLIKNHDNFEVYVDSPLANEATNIFKENMSTCFDDEAMELVKSGINPIGFVGLKTSITSDDSRAINDNPRPKVIISASGMCEAGRIKHHLKHNLWREECTVLFVGYQAYGTLGRTILEGASKVKLFGEDVEVRADIRKLAGVSGHADNNGLIEWVKAFDNTTKKIFIIHGEDEVTEIFANRLHDEYNLVTEAPFSGDVWDLEKNICVVRGPRTKIVRKTFMQGGQQVSAMFARLVKAGKRLMDVIQHNKGGTNKDLAKFTNAIISLCDKWDR